MLRPLRQLIQFLAHDLEFHWGQDGSQDRRQRTGNGPISSASIGGMLDRAQLCDVLASLDKTTNEVHTTVNDPPRQIAAEGLDEQCADFFPARAGNAERTSEGQNHEETEPNLRNSFHGFERPFRRFGRDMRSLATFSNPVDHRSHCWSQAAWFSTGEIPSALRSELGEPKILSRAALA